MAGALDLPQLPSLSVLRHCGAGPPSPGAYQAPGDSRDQQGRHRPPAWIGRQPWARSWALAQLFSAPSVPWGHRGCPTAPVHTWQLPPAIPAALAGLRVSVGRARPAPRELGREGLEGRAPAQRGRLREAEGRVGPAPLRLEEGRVFIGNLLAKPN